MLLIWKVAVKTGGTGGPVLGDNNATTLATPLWPLTYTALDDKASIGAKTSIFNQATRVNLTVARVSFIALKANSNPAGVGARGTLLASMSQAAAGLVAPGFTIGFGDRNDINLGDLDVDVTTNGEGWLVIAEIR